MRCEVTSTDSWLLAEHGVTVDHLKSFVHLASLGLAMLSHHLGMTEGHEEEEEEKA